MLTARNNIFECFALSILELISLRETFEKMKNNFIVNKRDETKLEFYARALKTDSIHRDEKPKILLFGVKQLVSFAMFNTTREC